MPTTSRSCWPRSCRSTSTWPPAVSTWCVASWTIRWPPASTLVALADHPSFAIKRSRSNIVVDYPLRAEVVHLYPREVALAERIVASVNAELEVPLDPDEAMPIALHLVNSSFNAGDLSQTYLMTGVFSQIFDVIENGWEWSTASL